MSESTRKHLQFAFSIIGGIIGVGTAIIAYRNYTEGKELRVLQKEMTALQLKEIKDRLRKKT